jgi:hypothetical protein
MLLDRLEVLMQGEKRKNYKFPFLVFTVDILLVQLNVSFIRMTHAETETLTFQEKNNLEDYRDLNELFFLSRFL